MNTVITTLNATVSDGSNPLTNLIIIYTIIAFAALVSVMMFGGRD